MGFSLHLAALLVLPVARAHYPHDVAWWAAVSPDASVSRVATSLERIDIDLLGRSEDGRTWAARAVQATTDGEVTSGAFLTADRLVLATSARGLLVSEDAGDTLLSETTVSDAALYRVVASPDVLQDGIAFAVGRSAVWRTADGGDAWARVRNEGSTDLAVSPDFTADGRVCVAEDDVLACSRDRGETWSTSSLPLETFRISVGSDDRTWSVVRGDGLYLSVDDGASWSRTGFEGEDLVVVSELSGGLVLLARGDDAGWRSTDGGASWEEVDAFHVDVDQSADGVNFFDFFEGPDGAAYMRCWYGLARSDDRGVTWTFYNAEPIQNTHSVTVTEWVDGTLRAWIGTYGGGPILVDLDDLTTQTFPSLRRNFTRTALATASWERDGTAVFDEGYSTWRSTDHGGTWTQIASDLEDGHMGLGNDVKGITLSPNTQEDPFLLSINGQGAMTFQTSEDLGDTWSMGSQDPPCAASGFAVALSPRWPDESRAWAACGGDVYETVDRGAHWTVLGQTLSTIVFNITELSDGRLLVGTSNGLWRMDGAGSSLVAFGGRLVTAVAASPEGDDATAFALVPILGWLRSEDGGSTWTALAAPTEDVPRMISLSPHFAQDGTLAVAGYGGAWASTDRGETWRSILTVEVWEGNHDAWRSTGTWTEEDDAFASGRTVEVTNEPGASRTLEFRGVGVAVEAPVDAAQGTMEIRLDDVIVRTVTLPSTGKVLWMATDLPDTWHSLRVEALTGTVTLDAACVSRIPVNVKEVQVTGHGCGDEPSTRAGILLLPLLFVRLRRGARRSVAQRHL